MKKVGILGGTFDPPHYGHLLIANEVMTTLNLSEVWFMPAAVPPHKNSQKVSDVADRLKMIQLAIEENDKFKIEKIEITRSGPSYTYDTMKLLVATYPDTKFYFIIGGDMVEYLPKWNNIDELVKLIQFVGVKRPGYSMNSPYTINEVETPEFGVSSSMIRKRYSEGRSTKYLLPERVREFIKEKSLYGA
ncbi:nicotinate-nucleotide adenylyltransferase [Bacillus timonensis]|nr:nicotinate-nucleotide adenylyltransferase [Bacillus timonensis]